MSGNIRISAVTACWHAGQLSCVVGDINSRDITMASIAKQSRNKRFHVDIP